MFYQFNSGNKKEISAEKIDSGILTAGYVHSNELEHLSKILGFADSTVESCKVASKNFRSGVEVYDDYTFTELRILSKPGETEDCVALYVKKNLFLVVDVEDHDGSTKEKFISALQRYSPAGITLEKIIYSFFENLVNGDVATLEEFGVELSELEEDLLNEKTDKEFNADLLKIKKILSKFHNYYEQILDITETIDENENDIFDSDCLMYITNITKKVERLKEDTDSLVKTVEHLQGAYSSFLDIKMNNTMKIFTVITSVFFPLTIIVGWYGMNFQGMHEYAWKYGYLYVIALSAITVISLFIFGKRKKWF